MYVCDVILQFLGEDGRRGNKIEREGKKREIDKDITELFHPCG